MNARCLQCGDYTTYRFSSGTPLGNTLHTCGGQIELLQTAEIPGDHPIPGGKTLDNRQRGKHWLGLKAANGTVYYPQVSADKKITLIKIEP